jgi:hypothetical protein
MSSDALAAHSHVEACLYFSVIRCDACRSGALTPTFESSQYADGAWRVFAHCTNCGAAEAYSFRVPAPPARHDPLSSDAPINATPEPSEIIDPVQWVTLAKLMSESAADTPDAGERRWRKIRAAQCLDEALKFYDDDNELPPAEALRTDDSRSAVRDHPQRYARSRLLDQRGALPVDGVANRVTQADSAIHPRKPWWRFWQRS